VTNLSLCSGYGGLDLAVEQITGNKTLVYAENDKYAAQVMAARFPWATNLGDISKTNWADVAQQYQIETLAAGFPCQGLSNAGLRKGLLDARSALWKNVAEAVRVIRPRLVFLENVAAIRSGASTKSSPTWPRSGMTRDGLVYELETRPSARRTRATAGSSSPIPLLKTPTAQLGVNGGPQHPDKRKAGGHGPTLEDEVVFLLLPPPAA
jgi:DNA (cytosine-5)-methyltransferase 1